MDGEQMALMTATREFNWHRPRSVFSFCIKAGETKSFPHDFVDAAVAAGAATRVTLTAETKPPPKPRRRRRV